MQNEHYESMVAALQAAGRRLTPQRLAICQHLATSREHPSPNDVYRHVRGQFPTISLATVYNTLAVLRDLGAIIEIPAHNDGARYETDLSPHVNLVCLRCGRITDLPLDDVENVRSAILGNSDFELRGLRIDGFGLCAVCREQI